MEEYRILFEDRKGKNLVNMGRTLCEKKSDKKSGTRRRIMRNGLEVENE